MAIPSSTRVPAHQRPVARVLPLLGLPQLDRLFDYRVDEKYSADVLPGVRVRVRFAGRLVDAIVYERAEHTDHPKELAWVERVLSPDTVVTPEIFSLVERVAARWVGTRSDVFRLAVPPRHAAGERSVPPAEPSPEGESRAESGPAGDAARQAVYPDGDEGGGDAAGDSTESAEPAGSAGTTEQSDAGEERAETVEESSLLPKQWTSYPRAEMFAAAVAEGRPVRGAWAPIPGEDWAGRLAELALLGAAGGKQSIVVVPDQRDVDAVVAALRERIADHGLLASSHIVELTASLGPQARYSRWLRALRGHARVIVGTRSAVWTPLRFPGLLILWDDGDDSFVEQRAPYPHTREVATLRSALARIPLLLAGPVRTPEVAALVEAGWAPEISASPDARKAAAPRIVAVTNADPVQARDVAGGHTRLPTVAMTMARQALDRGRPVLVQVPRRGYVPRLVCQRCRTPARCRRCNGPLEIGKAADDGAGQLVCAWCGVHDLTYSCPECGSRRLRAGIVGAARTAEELGRMFPGTRIARSSGTETLSAPPEGPMLVVSTPGAEPPAEGGYGAALLLDAWSLLNRPDLRATQEAFRRWVGAATLVGSWSNDGGEVFCSAEAGLDVAQSLIRWDVEGFGHRELAERREVGFPPAAHMFAIDGAASDVMDVSDYLEEQAAAQLGAEPEILGPVDVPESEPLPGVAPDATPERILVRVPARRVDALAAAIKAAVVSRASRREGQAVRVRLDPLHIG